MIYLLLSTMAWAEEHGAAHLGEVAHGAHEVIIPWSAIFVQTFNFVLLFAVLFLLLRKSVKAHFADRAATYRELVDRAENARKEAEKNRQHVQDRLAKLEASTKDNAKRAAQEATELRQRLVSEAQSLARKLEQEAQRTIAVEIEKAKAELRKDLLEKALANSKESLKKSLGSNEQKKLQNEFVQKIELVGG